jgi:carboxylesterase
MTARQPKDIALHTGSKSLIYLIHGITGTPAEMLYIGHGLARRGWDVYIPTLPGHCRRVRDLIRTNAQEWRDHVHVQLKFAKENYQSVFAAGLSVGALLALDAASRLPLDGVGVLSPTFVYDGWNTPWSQAILPLAMRFVPRRLQPLFFHVDGPPYGIKDPVLQDQIRAAYRPSAILSEWLHAWWPIHKTSSAERTKRHRSNASTGYPFVPLSTFAQIQSVISCVRKLLPKVQAPTLILQSQEDDVTSPRNAQIVYDNVASQAKEIVLLDDCYHVITVDKQRNVVLDRLNDFFTAHAKEKSAPPPFQPLPA